MQHSKADCTFRIRKEPSRFAPNKGEIYELIDSAIVNAIERSIPFWYRMLHFINLSMQQYSSIYRTVKSFSRSVSTDANYRLIVRTLLLKDLDLSNLSRFFRPPLAFLTYKAGGLFQAAEDTFLFLYPIFSWSFSIH